MFYSDRFTLEVGIEVAEQCFRMRYAIRSELHFIHGRSVQPHCRWVLECSNIPTSVERSIEMAITTLSSRELNHDVSRAKKAAKEGPVFITDRGRPAHVLLSFEDYQRLTQQRRNIADALAMPGVEDIEFEPPRVEIGSRPADLA